MTFASTRYKLPPGETPSVPLVRFEHLGNIARIILARPDAGNAINAALIADLSAAVDAARAVEPRSILVTAEGANFSLGGDLKHLLAARNDVAAELGRMAHAFHATQLRLIGTGGGPNGTGLTASYYDNADFTNAVQTRVDPTINFDWTRTCPAPDPARHPAGSAATPPPGRRDRPRLRPGSAIRQSGCLPPSPWPPPRD